MTQSSIIRSTAIVFAMSLVSLFAWAEQDASTSNATSQEVQQQTLMIDINSATASELSLLDNIGPKKAQSIIEYRKANGPFIDIKDLQNVKGIGEATIDKNSQRMLAGQ